MSLLFIGIKRFVITAVDVVWPVADALVFVEKKSYWASHGRRTDSIRAVKEAIAFLPVAEYAVDFALPLSVSSERCKNHNTWETADTQNKKSMDARWHK